MCLRRRCPRPRRRSGQKQALATIHAGDGESAGAGRAGACVVGAGGERGGDSIHLHACAAGTLLPQGPVEFALGDNAGAAGTTVLPLTLQAAGSAPGAALTAQVQMLDRTQAEGLSPLGFAFALQLHDDSPATASAAAAANCRRQARR